MALPYQERRLLTYST